MLFEVTGRAYSKKVGKSPVYKVLLKDGQGDQLTLVSDSKDIYAGYPEGEAFSVIIKKTQKVITDFPKESPGE
jgi:hypothetical protein